MFDTSKIGYTFPPFTFVVEPRKIRELAQAIGDDNPIYYSEQAAREAGYPSLPLLPTTGTIFLFWETPDFSKQLNELGLDVTRLIHREESYEYSGQIFPGETLMGTMTVLDGSTRKGPRATTIEMVTLQLRYINQDKQPVLVATTRLVSRD